MPGFSEPLAINIIGHTAGALLFAIFLSLLFSGRGWSGGRGRYLSGAAAGLALLWNLGSLLVLVVPGLSPTTVKVLAAASFSVLSLLPAVLLHVWLDDGRRGIQKFAPMMFADPEGVNSDLVGAFDLLHELSQPFRWIHSAAVLVKGGGKTIDPDLHKVISETTGASS